MNELKVLFSQEEVKEKIEQMANQLNEKYKNSEEVIFICVLSGSFMFFSDLVKLINVPLQTEFIKVSSYENSLNTGIIKEVFFNLPNLEDKDVVIVEDIVDTGITAKYLIERITKDFKPKSVCFVSLLDKKCARKIDINPDMRCFEIDNKFIIGYGLDDEFGRRRNIPFVGYKE